MDLNLLLALDALLQTGSVAKAAERMHLSAPAMSRTLGRLRDATGDPLFVRAGRGLVPTPRALGLRERVRDAVRTSAELLAPEASVDPRHFERVLTLRVNDGVIATFGSELLARARHEAPGLVLRFVNEGDENVAELRDGGVDLDIGVQDNVGPEIRIRSLFDDTLIVLLRAGAPRPRLTLAGLCRADHVIVSGRGRTVTRIDALLQAQGRSRRVVAVVPNALAAALLVAESDAVCIGPRSFATAVARVLPVRHVALPLAVPPVRIALAWHPRYDKDPPHQWLRRTVQALVGRKPFS